MKKIYILIIIVLFIIVAMLFKIYFFINLENTKNIQETTNIVSEMTSSVEDFKNDNKIDLNSKFYFYKTYDSFEELNNADEIFYYESEAYTGNVVLETINREDGTNKFIAKYVELKVTEK